MRRLHADLAAYAFLIAVSLVVIRDVTRLENIMPGDLGPAFFPSFMAWAVIGLCILGAIRGILRDASDGRALLTLPGRQRILVTFGATAAFMLLWQTFGAFYVLGFAYLSGLLVYFMSDGPLRARHVAIILIVCAVIMLLIRLFFTEILYVRF